MGKVRKLTFVMKSLPERLCIYIGIEKERNFRS